MGGKLLSLQVPSSNPDRSVRVQYTRTLAAQSSTSQNLPSRSSLSKRKGFPDSQAVYRC